MATAVGVTQTNNAEIDGLLGGTKWSGTISYSFPDSPSDYPANYYGNGEPTTSGFASAPAAMQQAIIYAISLIAGYTNASFQFAGTNGADIAIAQSPAANPTSYAYYPANVPAGGDVWFGTQYNYSLAALGNYYFGTALHELGHALGLKHSQETGGVANVAVPAAHDNSEYTVMSYRSYAGAPLTGYTAESYGFSQTYMANDILALQTLYGANYATHSENTVYSWSPTTGQMFINGVAQLAPGNGAGGSANRVFETIWDGNGVDTYDLSNYTTAVTINLNPGASSITSSTQLAYLGNGHYAAGNIYNAYLFNGDVRSYIENAIGGSGNDTIIGNAIANTLNGGGGSDTLNGGDGNDRLIGGPGIDNLTGGSGADTFVFASGETSAASGQHDRITDFVSGLDHIDLRGIDAISGTGAYDLFNFIGASAFNGSAGQLNYFYNSALGVTTLQGDTNGDGIADFAIDITGNLTISRSDLIGIANIPVIVEGFGATNLIQFGSNYYFDATGTSTLGSGPQFKYNGAPVYVGEFGSWAPIGVEQTASGYLVAWKVTGADLYNIWNIDSSGNFVSNYLGNLTGVSPALQSFEPSFHQDLNGNGVIDVSSTTIESAGSTSLVQAGGNYFFNPVGGGSGPQFKYNGAPVYVGEFGSWAPIGVEQTANGYLLAWKVTGADLYNIWNIDSSGNFVSNNFGNLTGASPALQSGEPSFHQDLNGDGVIGVVPSTIESVGLTSLVQAGGSYFFNPVGGGSGPQFKYNGAPVYVGEFGSWAPIGVEQTASGYLVAWKVTGADLYNIWNIDSSGNFVSNYLGNLTGASPALQSFELSFHQDLNGNGIIDVSSTTIESAGSTSLVQAGGNYFFNPVGGGSGPQFKYNGAPVYVGEFGSWAPIGVEQTANGYLVAWKVTGADLYNIWNIDSSGNFVSNNFGNLTGASPALQSGEPSFHQDLNGDGVIGVVPSTIESVGLTSLVQAGGSYFFNPVGGGSGPQFKYNGAPVYVGEFGSWAPMGVEQTASGYLVAWKVTGADLYNIWNIDSSGNFVSNYLGNLTGVSPALQSFEPSFHQDLNGNGVIDVSSTTIESAGSTSLVQAGGNYFFNPVGGGSGPQFKYNGAPVYVGEFGSWAPIGVEQTANGYLLAWKVTGADLYNIWNIDSSGNFVSNNFGNLTGASPALQSGEPSFHQDLNGDGVIGQVANQPLASAVNSQDTTNAMLTDAFWLKQEPVPLGTVVTNSIDVGTHTEIGNQLAVLPMELLNALQDHASEQSSIINPYWAHLETSYVFNY
ncbi:M10 family metallopeptidase C-terminal domain-containing protein [Bradyrhizobium sp. BWA-3-5]|uniref:M10 family metallopeptidase C-terminal domain-containing protein n=1 Tax=Bradyrhizobium sp. BWA-3-5 TaxID=3080013 RepID=UPI00293F55E2|nr:M10 family metallopeptidase C-terminal domain-containing protein [Bradyrhizobium sp. BWA-3-5]WOH68172.1 M10 family metallopeptidase C-terminal domain-containing protein [Bradyrhizobium sp. BWA-3-5]